MIIVITKITDKWKPFNGILISAFVSVDGNFNKVTISEKSENNNVRIEDAIKNIKYKNDAHHDHNFLLNVPMIRALRNSIDSEIKIMPFKSVIHWPKNGKIPLNNKRIRHRSDGNKTHGRYLPNGILAPILFSNPY